MSDPWTQKQEKEEQKQNAEKVTTGISTNLPAVNQEVLLFEDNFINSAPQQPTAQENAEDGKHKPLPDSQSYLEGLERKLNKLKKGSNLVEALAEKRQDCLRALLQKDEIFQSATTAFNNNELLDLDTPLNSERTVAQELLRHLQPVQAVNVGETVHIVKHDQLEQEQLAAEAAAAAQTKLGDSAEQEGAKP